MKPLKTILIILAAVLFSVVNSHALTIDFDAYSPGEPVTTIDGVDFSSNTGLGLIISTGFDTSSGFNYLGVDDGDVFLGGEEIYLDFSEAYTYISVSFISAQWVYEGDFVITTDSGQAVNSAIEDAVFDDGGYLYTVVFESDTAFTSATLSSYDDFLINFNVDDIILEREASAVPEPASALLIMVGLLGVAARSRK